MWAVVLRLTELCKLGLESRAAKPQIINNKTNHLALFDMRVLCMFFRESLGRFTYMDMSLLFREENKEKNGW